MKHLLLPLLALLAVGGSVTGHAAPKPHLVLVVGTLHYSPGLTLPLFAQELERFGFRTTIVKGGGDPEKKTENVLPGIGVLAEADVVIFFPRFLQLPDREWQPIEDYLKSGKPVIGLRTATHAFKYPTGHPRYNWNDDFGRRAIGTPYIVHQAGTTQVGAVPKYQTHHRATCRTLSRPTRFSTPRRQCRLPARGLGRDQILFPANGTCLCPCP
jgi:hypothetical protein